VTCNAPHLSSGHERSAVAGMLTFPLDDHGQDSYGLWRGALIKVLVIPAVLSQEAPAMLHTAQELLHRRLLFAEHTGYIRPD
jgi:hypothetical protein